LRPVFSNSVSHRSCHLCQINRNTPANRRYWQV
jgi:hypothetical protein